MQILNAYLIIANFYVLCGGLSMHYLKLTTSFREIDACNIPISHVKDNA